MNEQLLDGLNSLAVHVPPLDPAARFLASGGIYVIALLAGVLGLQELWRSRDRGVRVAGAAAFALLMSFVCIQLAGHWVYEVRPFVSDPDTVQLLPHAADNSFPRTMRPPARRSRGWRRSPGDAGASCSSLPPACSALRA